MTDPRDRSRGRRRFLAAAGTLGTVALAGCTVIPWISDDGETHPSFTAADARVVLTEDAPTVEPPVPVNPEDDAVSDGLEDIDELLAALPEPLDAEAIPNGVVRESIVDDRDAARERRDDVEARVDEHNGQAETNEQLYHALRMIRDARDDARAAAVAVAAIDDPSVADELEAEHATVSTRLADRRGVETYRGDDGTDERLRAALFYGRREADLSEVDRRLGRWGVSSNDDVTNIGSAAGDLEFAAATADVWDHLDERHDAELEDSTDHTAAFEATIEETIDRVESSAFGEPQGDWFDAARPADLESSELENVLYAAGRPAERARDDLFDADADERLGAGIDAAIRFETGRRAFERIRERIEDGSLDELESAAEIRAEREAAIDAAESAIESIDGPSPGAHVRYETLRSLERTDDATARAAANDLGRTVSLHGEFEDYVQLRARLEALPDGVEAVRSRLL